MNLTKQTMTEIEILTRLYQRINYEGPLKPAQWQVLRFYETYPGASLKSLADYRRSTMGTTSTTVSQLVKRGLLRRGSGGGDRNVCLNLTEAGMSILKQDPLRQVEAALCEFGQSDVMRLRDVLVRLRTELEGGCSGHDAAA